MEKGWKATGRLKPLWGKVGGRDGLAAATKINGQTLSAYNSGSRPLGIVNARRIAEALGVSVLDLGGPVEDSDEAGKSVLALLEELSAKVDAQGKSMTMALKALTAGIRRLERRLEAEAPRANRKGSARP